MGKNDSNAISDIVKKNILFYKSVQKEFDQSRKYPWTGFLQVLNIVKKNFSKKIYILDIACGNGRFLKYICQGMKRLPFSYLGIDTNDYFLAKASQTNAKNATLKNIDAVSNLTKIKRKFNVVVAFGFTHHIPKEFFFNKWLYDVSGLVKNNGLLVLSFWRPKAKVVNNQMGFSDNNKKRFVYVYKESDLKVVIKQLNTLNYKLIKKFKPKEGSDKQNIYLVFKKFD